MESLKKFIAVVVDIFFEEYLRSPNNEDIARLLAHGESCEFSGMLGSIDCMHWKLKNCPTAYKGQFIGDICEPTIILEAMASINGNDHNGKLACRWRKTILAPQGEKRKLFRKA